MGWTKKVAYKGTPGSSRELQGTPGDSRRLQNYQDWTNRSGLGVDWRDTDWGAMRRLYHLFGQGGEG